MKKEIISTKAPSAIGPYSQGMIVEIIYLLQVRFL